MTIEAMLADRHPVVRSGLRRMIEETTEHVAASDSGPLRHAMGHALPGAALE